MNLDFLNNGVLGLIAPALIAGLLVASTHVPLGREVLRRGIIFLDLAVAQIAGLGAVAATVFLGWSGAGVQLVAFACALGAALAFSALERAGQEGVDAAYSYRRRLADGKLQDQRGAEAPRARGARCPG